MAGEPAIDGEGQGQGDVPQLYNLHCGAILNIHRELAPGLSIHNPTQDRQIDHNNVTYADDNDGHKTSDRGHPEPIRNVVAKLEISSQTWNDLTVLGGGSVALH